MITWQLLQQQNADTSNALLEHFKDSARFRQLAQLEGDLTRARDQEDADKLQKGIDFAIAKGVIPADFEPEPYQEIDVLGQTPEQVAASILKACNNHTDHTNTTNNSTHNNHHHHNSPSHLSLEQAQPQAQAQPDAKPPQPFGKVIVLVGLSGTGKGTTVTQLQQALQAHGDPVVCWSNGNIFRAVTLLAVTWWQLQQEQFAMDTTRSSSSSSSSSMDVKRACSAENLQQYMTMLSFGKIKGRTTPTGEHNSMMYDTRICGFGLDYQVSDIQNTVLKAPILASHIPAVAEYTQGEVIVFAAHAVQTLRNAGITVLLEGREQTVNYVRTPHRFALTLSDTSLIGQRRAAQRIMAAAAATATATAALTTSTTLTTDLDDVTELIDATLESLVLNK